MTQTTRPPGELRLELKAMDAKAVDEYMKELLRGDHSVGGLEAEILERFRAKSAEIEGLTMSLRQIEEEGKRLRSIIPTVQGEVIAYVGLLTQAEDRRRSRSLEDQEGDESPVPSAPEAEKVPASVAAKARVA